MYSTDQLEAACKKYADMGIKGFKVDFLDRDDQTAVEMVYRIAEMTARYKLTLICTAFTNRQVSTVPTSYYQF